MSSTITQSRKEYLIGFLGDYNYPVEAQRALTDAFDLIFSDRVAALLYEEILRRFEKDPDEKYTYLIEASEMIAGKCAINRYTVYLLVLILLSESSKRIYAERKVSKEMWRDNMRDLKYWCDQCILTKGVCGTFCPDWSRGFLSAKRFTFGKLQFEIDRIGKPYEKGDVRLLPDDKVIFIHIPRTGERLLPEDVEESCARASAFFRERYGITQVIFACHSWILYPENKNILSEKSNLYSFISRFEVIDVVEDTDYKELWRLFDVDYTGNAEELPQDTSLRRAYAQRVKENLPLGVALGVWIYKE